MKTSLGRYAHEVSTIVVVTFSGVPILGGMVIMGKTGCKPEGTNTSFTKDMIKLDLPVASSPQTHTRTSAAGNMREKEFKARGQLRAKWFDVTQ